MASKDASTTCFIDVHWLQHFELRRENVMHYFYTSPFFDSTSNNAITQTQGIDLEHLKSMRGLEFMLDDSIREEPFLFVIRKQMRSSPSHTDLLEAFYILDGTIYQTPGYLQLVRSRFLKMSLAINNAFSSLTENLEYTPQRGHHLKIKEATEKQDEISAPLSKRIRAEEDLFPDMSAIFADIDAHLSRQ